MVFDPAQPSEDCRALAFPGEGASERELGHSSGCRTQNVLAGDGFGVGGGSLDP